MNVCMVKLIKDAPPFSRNKCYDAFERENDFVLFHHTGWFSVEKESVEILKEDKV